MKNFLDKIREIAITGFFALFPLCVLLIIITKAWGWLSSAGSRIAAMFGLKPFLGVGGIRRPTSIASAGKVQCF